MDLVVGIVAVAVAAAVFVQLAYHCSMFFCHKLQMDFHKLQMNGKASEEEEMAQISYWMEQSLQGGVPERHAASEVQAAIDGQVERVTGYKCSGYGGDGGGGGEGGYRFETACLKETEALTGVTRLLEFGVRPKETPALSPLHRSREEQHFQLQDFPRKVLPLQMTEEEEKTALHHHCEVVKVLYNPAHP